ncbi:hypothetical protein Q0F98_11385 [Paenibacillus amylolyticus]|nr:hypothetical protein Q0F98_11385 [Paenibacillus amylolyticus]
MLSVIRHRRPGSIRKKMGHPSFLVMGAYPEDDSELNETTGELTVNEEMNEIMGMLHTLNTRDLKKAKAVLEDVFFTKYED